jgi:hypothetical protein
VVPIILLWIVERRGLFRDLSMIFDQQINIGYDFRAGA